jgi:hypothetical protein
MRVDALHRRIAADVRILHAAVQDVLPVVIPARFETTALNLRTFVEHLNERTERLSVYNEMHDDHAMEPGMVRLTGLWLPKEQLPENGSHADIRIIWHTHPDTKRLYLSPPEWNRRRYFFWQMYMHELVHRHQDVYRMQVQNIRVYRPRSTDRDTRQEQTYYGNYDEIEAHSHDTAIELFIWWKHLTLRNAIHEVLRYSGRLLTPTYCVYEATFGDTPGHPAMAHFKRKVKAWYEIVKKNPEIYELLQLPNLVA